MATVAEHHIFLHDLVIVLIALIGHLLHHCHTLLHLLCILKVQRRGEHPWTCIDVGYGVLLVIRIDLVVLLHQLVDGTVDITKQFVDCRQ